MKRLASLLPGLLAAVALGGCATGQRSPVTPLGRPIAASSQHTLGRSASTPAPAGDPPSERGGTVPPAALAAQQSVGAALLAATPQLALERYALVYVNWRAAQLPEHEQQLARMSIGAARLVAQQTAAGGGAAAALAANHVANSGQVIAIAPGQGGDAGEWVVVTQEHTTGAGPYAGLPPGPHVTLAEVTHEPGGWVVSRWLPIS